MWGKEHSLAVGVGALTATTVLEGILILFIIG